MALNRYTLSAAVTLTPDTLAAPPGFGCSATVSPATAGKWGLWPLAFGQGQAIYLDPSGALYSAIGAGNLAAWRDGTDAVSHAALSDLRRQR